MRNRVEGPALGIARGMAYLHSRGIALRDLKPDNIGFDESDTVKLFDFGMARKVVIAAAAASTDRRLHNHDENDESCQFFDDGPHFDFFLTFYSNQIQLDFV